MKEKPPKAGIENRDKYIKLMSLFYGLDYRVKLIQLFIGSN